MHLFGFSYRRLSIWILILVQLFIIFSYIYFQMDEIIDDNLSDGKVKFLASELKVPETPRSYHTINNRIILPLINTRRNFIDFNSSMCYINGTDLKAMNRTKTLNWKCYCMPGWHGTDCGQPEVIWRAVLTHHKTVSIKGPKLYERRIIYIFKVDELTETLADIRMNELGDVVDLFVLYEDEESTYLESKLNNQYNQQFQKKILYLKCSSERNLWQYIKQCVKNLRHDDIILTSNNREIHNKLVLGFLKNYNGWPEPVMFRLRWSVYGFFWTHPNKTAITSGLSTVLNLKNISNYDIETLMKSSTTNKAMLMPLQKGIIFGDLNHYGGWCCEYCNDAGKIVEMLSAEGTSNAIMWDKINKDKIDDSYIEELIENGIYVDGKTELRRARRYQDSYFAPTYVIDSYKYDFLMMNFYSKVDYYEG